MMSYKIKIFQSETTLRSIDFFKGRREVSVAVHAFKEKIPRLLETNKHIELTG
jgi:hypothetical protein